MKVEEDLSKLRHIEQAVEQPTGKVMAELS